MYLIFDTETTGFLNKQIPIDDPNQGRVCQMAALLLDDSFNEISHFTTLIKPDNWNMSPGAEAVHGISRAKCEKHGLKMSNVLTLFEELSSVAKYKIAHNSRFDTEMIDNEVFIYNQIRVNWHQIICTMNATTDICKLPSKTPGKFKWPKLAEAYRHITNKTLDKAHDAMADVRGCAVVFKWLIQNNHIVLAK